MAQPLGYHRNCGGRVHRHVYSGYPRLHCTRCGGTSVHPDDIQPETHTLTAFQTRQRIKHRHPPALAEIITPTVYRG